MANNENISPTEDLMREHGILNRILLIYEEILRRISMGISFDLAVVNISANLIKTFIEEYHEQIEEQYIFPHFIESGTYVDLINELIMQHKISRTITTQIIEYSSNNNYSFINMKKISKCIKKFIYMYRAHESREDTIVFDKFRYLISKETLDEYAELFERIEHELFGPEGSDGILEKVIDLEKQLSINDLRIYTPNY